MRRTALLRSRHLSPAYKFGTGWALLETHAVRLVRASSHDIASLLIRTFKTIFSPFFFLFNFNFYIRRFFPFFFFFKRSTRKYLRNRVRSDCRIIRIYITLEMFYRFIISRIKRIWIVLIFSKGNNNNILFCKNVLDGIDDIPNDLSSKKRKSLKILDGLFKKIFIYCFVIDD